jgi:hypothetical protein
MLQSCGLRDGGTYHPKGTALKRLLKGNTTHNFSYPSHFYLRTRTHYDVIDNNIKLSFFSKNNCFQEMDLLDTWIIEEYAGTYH